MTARSPSFAVPAFGIALSFATALALGLAGRAQASPAQAQVVSESGGDEDARPVKRVTLNASDALGRILFRPGADPRAPAPPFDPKRWLREWHERSAERER